MNEDNVQPNANNNFNRKSEASVGYHSLTRYQKLAQEYEKINESAITTAPQPVNAIIRNRTVQR